MKQYKFAKFYDVALVQMQDVASAINALQFYANVQPTIRGRNVYVQFSSYQELTSMDQNQGRGDEVGIRVFMFELKVITESSWCQLIIDPCNDSYMVVYILINRLMNKLSVLGYMVTLVLVLSVLKYAS
ncbi:uncharacterized protein LOC110276156 isoform X2 [Arachis duranensis]|uniref:Uncharacterized protein LOC110276156 isoform X2 n=1 Tax=Arachis duranensis TaxID=130453 RepID=A0A9C6TM25_ARADU|nr:uncharacterized protein LOC110276156 isoform X2 [Arachis duranensis]